MPKSRKKSPESRDESSKSRLYIEYVRRSPNADIDFSRFPGNLPFVKELDLNFDCPITFFVGENGSGKSTLMEAIADLAGFPSSGGSTNETSAELGEVEENTLASCIRIGMGKTPRDGFFFRAERQSHFASLLDARKRDPNFYGVR